jgi:hypothetical protein
MFHLISVLGWREESLDLFLWIVVKKKKRKSSHSESGAESGAENGGEPEEKIVHRVIDGKDDAHFSLFGVFCIVIIGLVICVVVLNFLMTMIGDIRVDLVVEEAYYQALIWALLHIYLLVCSAVVKTPDKQPFKILYMMARVLVLCMTAFSGLTFHNYYMLHTGQWTVDAKKPTTPAPASL